MFEVNSMRYTIEQLKNVITPIAQKYGVKSVALFGSYSRGEATENSDVDLIIEKGKIETLFQLIGFRLDVQDALNLSVDVLTTEISDQDFLKMVRKDEILIYGAA